MSVRRLSDRSQFWPLLSKYPRLLALALFGTSEPNAVSERLRRAVAGDRDRSGFIPYISEIAEQTLGERPSPAQVMPRKLRRRLAGLAFESGSSAECPESIWISTTRLCHCLEEDDISFESSLKSIGEFAFAARAREPGWILQLATLDFILVYDWEDIENLVLAHLSVSVALGLPSLAAAAVSTKLGMREPDEWERGIWVYARGASSRQLVREFFCFRPPMGEEEFDRVVRGYEEVLSWLSATKPDGAGKGNQ